MRDACELQLATMPTSLAEDVTLAASADGTASLALSYRVAKKQLLSAVAGHAAASAATSAFAR